MFIDHLEHGEREHVRAQIAARVLPFADAGAAIELPAVSLVVSAS